MSTRVEPRLLQELKSYGAVNVEACFNCGNCTAVCPLSTDDASFPRRVIRLAQVGLRQELLSSKDLWMCYYCGECTSTCPRGADPGGFMAAARRYAIASYDSFGLGKLLQRRSGWSVSVLVALAGLLAGLMLTRRGPMPSDSLALFDFIPYPVIHNLGLAAMVIVAVTGLWGLANMIRQAASSSGLKKGVRYNWWRALWAILFEEVLAQKRYRDGCETGPDSQPWYRQKWFIHAATMWGFLGLLAATALDYATDILGIKATGTPVPIWSPIRLLGTLAGLLLVYGTTYLIIRRLSKADPSVEHSTAADWSFLVMMWLSGVTGFVLELALYLPNAPVWGYWMLLGHVTVAMEMVLLLPFTKFAHVIYRTAALYFHALKPLPEKKLKLAPSGTD